jgi:8-oxo-dGTP diphosphatase
VSTPPDDYTATLPRKRMGAGVLFWDPAGRMLLVEPVYKDHWEIPGGVVEAAESPYDAATREVAEELGLATPPGRLLVVDWVPPRPGRTDGLMMVYDGGNLSPQQTEQIALPPEELRGWAWCTEEEAGTRLSALLARRATAAVKARDTGVTLYLENGHIVA